MSGTGECAEFEFAIDLTADEFRRRAEVIKALGPEWNPIAAMEAEDAAYNLLYSELDAEQHAALEQLAEAGVLLRREPGRGAA